MLGEHVHVVGLTATSPAELAGDEADLYAELLGPVDFEIATPAVVRDGHLAPYQELACFATPLASERAWLAERHIRFAEMVDRLHDPAAPAEEDLAFGAWVIGRLRYRDSGDGAARVAFATLAAKRPDLARAGLRYLHDAGLDLPDDAPRGEGWRAPPTLEDWLVLIGDYAVGCLRIHPGEAAERRFGELGTALRDLGFNLTRQGVRRGGSEVDRVLTSSAAKPLAAVEVLATEAESRGEELRALALCDSEHGERQPEGSPLALAGGARGVLRTLGEDIRSETLRPLMVTARTLACLPGQASALAAAVGATEVEEADGLALLHAPGWQSRDRVARAGEALAAGTTQLLVGTRGLLGEGWDAPRLNVLVDLTTVAADVSVRQMRGRALRLDPAAPDKLASNWDVVCVAPDLARGSADYARFVRRHAHLHAPCEDGSIETGVSHVHPALSPYQPPPETELAELNASALHRAADRGGARERWRLGEPYRGEDVPVLLVRRDATASLEVTGVAHEPGPPPALPKTRRPLSRVAHEGGLCGLPCRPGARPRRPGRGRRLRRARRDPARGRGVAGADAAHGRDAALRPDGRRRARERPVRHSTRGSDQPGAGAPLCGQPAPLARRPCAAHRDLAGADLPCAAGGVVARGPFRSRLAQGSRRGLPRHLDRPSRAGRTALRGTRRRHRA